MRSSITDRLELAPVGRGELVEAYKLAAEAFELPYTYETLRVYRFRARGGFIAARLSGHMVGFIVAVSPAIPALSLRSGEVSVLAVDGAYRRMGVGATLLAVGLDLLRERGMRHARLHVQHGNAGAIALYERFGFTVERRVLGYYRDGSDAFRMRLKL
jgi:[ribosomal protein S18]-alanine N-acetyltransferase